MPKPRFDVVWVGHAEDPSLTFNERMKKYAQDLKRQLNRLVQGGYEILKQEQGPAGVLLVAVKQDTSLQEQFRAHLFERFGSLSSVLSSSGIPTEEETCLTKDTTEFLDKVYAKSKSPGLASLLKKLPVVVPVICRDYQGEQLRVISDNIQQFKEEHAKKCKQDCQMGKILEAVIQGIRKSVDLNVC